MGLIRARNGKFYGETDLGGAHGQGTLFEISTTGQLHTLYTFCSQPNCADGSEPIAGLVQASDGNFYGTTSGLGGQSTSYGTVFRITPSGTLTTLHAFDYSDGSFAGQMIEGTDGNLYGTTWNGGAFKGGTLFKMTLDGTLTTLYNFCSQSGCADGETPIAGLTQDTNGEFYGTTELGGTDAACNGFTCGTVFSLSVGLGPFIAAEPPYGAVNAKIIIIGSSLKSTTRVAFNGKPATYTVISDSEIETIVPAGATTGAIKVVTPAGTLKSNEVFQVLK